MSEENFSKATYSATQAITNSDISHMNSSKVRCMHCSSLILSPGVATHSQHTEVSLPKMTSKAKSEESESSEFETEVITEAWAVTDMFHFDNVGFSHTVGDTKYLTCADCELGPIGWHSLNTKMSYVALNRVRQE